MKNISIRFAIIASIAFIVWVSIEHLLGYNTTKMEAGEYTRLASAYMFWLLIVIALIVKKKQQRGVITFAEGFKTGIKMVVIYSFITAFWLAFYQHVINPEFYPLIKQFSINQMQTQGKTELQIADAVKEIDMMYNGKTFSYLMYFVFSTVMGGVVALITSIILRRNKSLTN